MICPLCERPITPTARDYRQVLGWERKRNQGGTNALRLRMELQSFAHEQCVERASKHINPNQGSFL